MIFWMLISLLLMLKKAYRWTIRWINSAVTHMITINIQEVHTIDRNSLEVDLWEFYHPIPKFLGMTMDLRPASTIMTERRKAHQTEHYHQLVWGVLEKRCHHRITKWWCKRQIYLYKTFRINTRLECTQTIGQPLEVQANSSTITAHNSQIQI